MSRPHEASAQVQPSGFLMFRFDPRNDAQQKARDLFEKKKLLFLLGPAGTGKTHAAVALALEHTLSLLQKRKRDQEFPIVLTRPVVEAAGEQLGFIPGTVDDKIAPYLEPAYAVVDRLKRQILLPGDDFDLRKLFRAVPLAYARGHTFTNVALLEEAQNCNTKQLACFFTRMGKGCKMIVTVDPAQHDVSLSRGQKRRRQVLPILDVIKKLQDLDEVGVVHMTEADTLRDPFITKVITRLGITTE